MRVFDVVKTVIEIFPGTDFDEARREALRLSLDTRSDIEFDFNGDTYKIKYEALLNVLK